VRGDHHERHGPHRHGPAESLAQQQEERRGRHQGGHDPDREQRIALETIEMKRHCDVAEDPVWLPARGQQRLVRRAWGRRDDRHEQDAEAREQDRAQALCRSSLRLLANIQDARR